MAKTQTRSRGMWLNIFLILSTIGLLIEFFQFFIDSSSKNIFNQTLWLKITDILILLFGILAIYGLWRWKKWGAYLLYFKLLIIISLNVWFLTRISDPSFDIFANILAGIVALVFWYWLLKEKWQFFK